MKKKNSLLFILVFIPIISFAQQVTTLAGSVFGFDDGAATAAKFSTPTGICTVNNGTTIDLYVVDSENNRIRKVDADGNVTTIAGSTYGSEDGPGSTARFIQPMGICTDGLGFLYVTDWANNRIRKINIATAAVSTLAGNTKGYFDASGAAAMFDHPYAICYGGNGDLFITDSGNHKIRKIVIATGLVTTVAGSTQGYSDGIGAATQFNNPQGVCSDLNGHLYVTDLFNNKIRKIDLANSAVTTIAGSTQGYVNGNGTATKFSSPTGICMDSNDNIYVSDSGNNRIRKISPTAEVTTLAGISQGKIDGTIAVASFYSPNGICIDSNGIFYIVDSGNHRIRIITGALLATTKNSFSIANLGIFPNPTENSATIIYSLLKDTVVDLQLFSNQGKQLSASKVNKSVGENSDFIDFNNQPSGIYFLKINTEGKSQTVKIIKK